MTRFFGPICALHPELRGERLLSNRRCIRCNRIKVNQYRKDNPKSCVARRRRHYLKDPSYWAQKKDKRRRAIVTPAWADKSKIAAIYQKARKLGLTVDHIVPINHPLVCGLHVHNNLRLMDRSKNSSKGNRFVG